MPVYDEWPSYTGEPIQFPRESTSGPASGTSRGEMTHEPLPFPLPERLGDTTGPYPGPYPGRYSNEGQTLLGPGEANPQFPPTYGGPPMPPPADHAQPARPRYTFPGYPEIPPDLIPGL